MLDHHPVIMFAFVGRKRYLEVLIHYALRCRPFVDRLVLCIHTADANDLAYIHSLRGAYPDFVELVDIGYKEGTRHHEFYSRFCDPGAYYVKVDDDICWMEDGAIEKLVKYKRDHPDLMVVFSNTVNNGLCSHIHQRMGLFDSKIIIPYDAHFVCHCPEMRVFALVHQAFINSVYAGTYPLWRSYARWIMNGPLRFSINCLCVLGADLIKAEPVINNAEVGDEVAMTELLPVACNRPNAIYGRSLVAHFSFGPQRAYLEESTDLLDQYRALVGLSTWREGKPQAPREIKPLIENSW